MARGIEEMAMFTPVRTFAVIPCASSVPLDCKICAPLSIRSGRHGLTLVEMLVALVCTMLLMMAYTQLFGNVGGRINEARSVIEMSNRLRSAKDRLQKDLAGATAELIPPLRPESGMGYFEIIEGPNKDRLPGLPDDPLTLDFDEASYALGDTDDLLMFTTRGQFTGTTLQPGMADPFPVTTAEVAEVVWFLKESSRVNGIPLYTLYRRTFLVVPNNTAGNRIRFSVGAIAVGGITSIDHSFHTDGTNYIANTLSDLTKRECRAYHRPTPFPHEIDFASVVPLANTALANRVGQDVVLTNVLAFDVQVWDGETPIHVNYDPAASPSPPSNATSLTPNDPGYYLRPPWRPNPPNPPQVFPSGTQGAYVDLGWNRSLSSWPANGPVPSAPFSTSGHPKSQLNNLDYFTYDTYSFHYEHDGVQQGSAAADQGTDGFDNNSSNGVDDVGERETMPPYPVPLRGIKIRIRVYEPDVRQVREVSVYHSFMPE